MHDILWKVLWKYGRFYGSMEGFMEVFIADFFIDDISVGTGPQLYQIYHAAHIKRS